jgi:hypothetical protein
VKFKKDTVILDAFLRGFMRTKASDERFATMAVGYEVEQKLKKKCLLS